MSGDKIGLPFPNDPKQKPQCLHNPVGITLCLRRSVESLLLLSQTLGYFLYGVVLSYYSIERADPNNSYMSYTDDKTQLDRGLAHVPRSEIRTVWCASPAATEIS